MSTWTTSSMNYCASPADILTSRTPCPECGGTRWQRWAYAWPLLGGESRWLPVMGELIARADWPARYASFCDGADGFDRCARCGLVIR